MKVPARPPLRRLVRGVMLACATVAALTAAPAPESKVVLGVPGVLHFRMAGYYVAQAKGYFADEGLDVELRSGRVGLGVVGTVVVGTSDYGISDARVLLARLNGAPLVLVAGIGQQGMAALLVRADSGITKASDLIGKRIALTTLPASFEFYAMLRAAGITRANTTLVDMAQGDRPLLQGTVDAQESRLFESVADLDAAGIATRFIDQSALSPDLFCGDSLVTTENEVEQNPARVAAMRRAVLKGWEYALDHRAEAVDILLANEPEESRTALRPVLLSGADFVAENVKPGLVPIGYLNEQRWARAAAACVGIGVASSTKRLDGFLYGEGRPADRNWLPWLMGTVAVGGASVLVVALVNLRLRRKVAESTEQLHAVENRWQLAVSGINDGIWDVNLLTHEIYLSDRAQEILGFAPGEYAPRMPEWVARMHPEDAPARLAALEAHLAGRSTHYRAEFRVRGKDGRYRWALSRGQAIRDAAGRPVRIAGSLSDINSHRLADEALRASEERYHGLFEFSPVAMLECDCRGIGDRLQEIRARGVTDLEAHFARHPDEMAQVLGQLDVTDVNQEAVRLLHAPDKPALIEFLREAFRETVHANRHAVVMAIWQGRNEASGEEELGAFDRTRVQTFYRWWAPLVRGQLNLARTQTGLIDVSHIRRMEAALAAESERLKVTLASMNEGVVTTDARGVVRYINEAAGRMTGWAPAAAVGRKIAEVCLLRTEPSGATLQVPFAEAFAGKRAVDLPPDTRMAHRDGGSRLVDGRCAPMHDLAGTEVGAVFVVRDITERSRLEAEQMRSSKLESVGLLAGGIAHDFNNLLTVIIGNIALSLLDAEVQLREGPRLRDAERGALRARDLTQQLLTFAKGGEPVRTAISLPVVVREAAEFARHGSSVKCEFVMTDEAWPAYADAGQISQVVQNIVINGIQAMANGGTVTIVVRNEEVGVGAVPPPGKWLKTSITDRGSGIAPEYLPRIFDPYFTTKHRGSGLGLATAYSIVKKHSGHLTVESEIGQGTTFHLWLPAAEEQPSATRQTRDPFARLQGRMLFMDDEELIRQSTARLIGKLGLELTLTSNGADAVNAYREAQAAGRPFDVVVLDLTVPGGMGGKQALEELLRIDPRVKAIVSSGYSSDPIMAKYQAHGFAGCITKPYTLSDFTKELRRVLGES